MELEDEERLGSMEQLRLKLNQANNRAEAALKRVEKTEERNMELLAEAKEREAEWLEEKKILEESEWSIVQRLRRRARATPARTA